MSAPYLAKLDMDVISSWTSVVEANPEPIRERQSGNPGDFPIRESRREIQSGEKPNPGRGNPNPDQAEIPQD